MESSAKKILNKFISLNIFWLIKENLPAYILRYKKVIFDIKVCQLVEPQTCPI